MVIVMRRSINIIDKYMRREYLWSRVKLSPMYRISEWRLGGTITKLYEKYINKDWQPIKRTQYEVSD